MIFDRILEHVVRSFGRDRIMYGSDWPVCLLAGRYEQNYAVLHAILSPHLNEDREAKVFVGMRSDSSAWRCGL
jgi:L-fuconolactonase